MNTRKSYLQNILFVYFFTYLYLFYFLHLLSYKAPPPPARCREDKNEQILTSKQIFHVVMLNNKTEKSVCFRCYCLEKSFIFLANENDQMVKQIKIGKKKFKHFVDGFKQMLARVKFFSVTHF